MYCDLTDFIKFDFFRYEMIKSTWQEEPEKRPSFSDIVRFLQDQNITDTPVDEAEITSVGTKNDSAYLNLSNSH